jgi:MATE family multidrug resistance protein
VFIVQSFSSQLFGRGDLVAARRYAWYGLFLAFATLLLSLFASPGIEPVLGLFSYEPDVHRLMGDYMAIRVWSVGAAVGTEAIGNWFAGQGNTHVQMRASLLTMVANVGLNWVLIYGNLGAPEMGVAGAALASTLATWLGFAYALFVFRGAERRIPRDQPLRLRLTEFLRMLRFGIPNGLNWFLEFAAFAIFINAIVAPLGTTVVAAFNVILQINSVSFMPAFGIASAGAILVGQAIGREAKDQVPRIVRTTATVNVIWQMSVGLIYLLLPGPLMLLFAPPGAIGDWMRVGTLMLAISGAWQLFDALGLTVGEALRAAGDTTWCMWARLLIAWLVFTPTAYVSVTLMNGGHAAVMWCVVFYLACLAAAMAWRFRGGAWRRIQLTGEELPVA